MKFQKAFAFLALFIAGWHGAAAQTVPPLNEPNYNKPKIFSNLPDKLLLRLTEAEALLNLSVGGDAKAAIAPNFLLSGKVVSKSYGSDASVQSIVIKSNLRNAVFSFSRIKNTDSSFVYRGRMLSREAGDALEIVKEADGYVLRKISYYNLLNE